ncbi:interferon gamma receptor 1-like precursor [Larimichthys crocea]|uniref:interferon gamma receptor 1-like precursor n=1 Tax=Larimichthys crocea TaxID=215358 RepID=UPI000F649661|nr:interferon gamma receptor 1-like precursor [Larimichthys crocea]
MSRGIFNPVFILLLVGIQLLAAHVDPPTSVTLDCHNLVHVVKWSYTEFSPGLQFEIYIGSLHGAAKLNLVDSPNLQTNFSLDTDPADTYTLEVSAVIGPNKSDEAPPKGIQFSYNKNSPASKKCFMDLPAVNVTVMPDGYAQFSFMHPWLLYGDKIPVPKPTKKKRHNARSEVIPEFSYEVVVVSKGTSKTFDCNERECEDELLVDPKEEKLCLKISGDMARMAVRGTQEYCAMPATALPAEDDYMYVIYIVVPLVVLIALAFILFLVYKKVTRPSSSLPAAMTFKDHLWRTVVRDRDQVSVPEVEPASPTPLLQSTEFPPAPTSSTEYEVRERIGVLTDCNGVCDDEEIGNNEGCGYTQGGNLDEDDGETKVEPSGYESRPVVD